VKRPWPAIVGIGEDGLAGLGPEAGAAVAEADLFIGGERHLAMLGDDRRPRRSWDTPLRRTVARIRRMTATKVCILASGDPMSYGIGVTLTRELGIGNCRVIPHQSAFSLACARLGWPLAEVDMLTVHGRPLTLINRHLRPNARLLVLSADGDTPRQLARALRDGGYSDSRMTVFEHMGGAREKRHDGIARTWRRRTADLNTIALSCRADREAPRLMRPAGLAGDFYQHDGQITKPEVRAATMAALAPAPGELLWDIGAGAGSISIEFLRTEPTARAIAVERDADRADNIRSNGAYLGVRDLSVVVGQAPAALKGLERPDVIFVGGGSGNSKLLDACWRALSPGGRLIVNAVSAEGEAALFAFMNRNGGEMTRLAISRLQPMGDLHSWRAMQPVTQYRGRKP
jgi:precorrin-6Y C5,15-methyltransferase (decarboxylating)